MPFLGTGEYGRGRGVGARGVHGMVSSGLSGLVRSLAIKYEIEHERLRRDEQPG